LFSDVDDSFGDFLSGVPSTTPDVIPVNIPNSMKSTTSDTIGSLDANPLLVPDVEKNNKKGICVFTMLFNGLSMAV